MRPSLSLAFAFLVLIYFPAAAHVAPTPKSNAALPPGLTQVDWNQIRAEHDRYRHTAFPQGDVYQARNREQQWTTTFDRTGFLIHPDNAAWSFGLELTSPTRPSVTVDKNRVSYKWSSNIEEWFVNNAQGLEHAFTIQQPSSLPTDGLTLKLAVRGGLSATGSGTALHFVDATGQAVVNYTGLKAWDANGRRLPARMQATGTTLTISVDDHEARYPVTIDPIVQQAYLKPAAIGSTQAGDNFGTAVAIAGDTVVVGANNENSSTLGVNSTPNELSPQSGAAYVFVRSNGSWTQQAYLKPAAIGTIQLRDHFGSAVAISGDTLIVGAPNESSSSLGVNSTPDEFATGAGAAYIFVRSGTSWTQQAYLKPAAVGTYQTGDALGSSVAIEGDTVIVGAPNEAGSNLGVNSTIDDAAPNAGAAYIFVRSGTTWTQQSYLKPAAQGASQAGDQFGFSVALSGDSVVVGANLEDSSTTGVNTNPNESAGSSGAAFVFTRSVGVWTQQAYLKPTGVGTTQAGDQFGTSVAISGDTLAVGARGEASSTTGINSTPNELAFGAGAVYAFTRSNGNWTQQAYIKPSAVGTTQTADSFGWAVALASDSLIVGAYNEASSTTGVNTTPDASAQGAGAAYVFVRINGAWTQQAYLKPAAVGTTQAGDNLGSAVAISADSFIVGAPTEDSSTLGINSTPNESSIDSGAAYTFVRSGAAITSIIDAGGFRPQIAPSSWVAIKGTSLSNTTRIWLGPDFVNNKLPTTLDGVSVTIDGIPASVYFISPNQINVLTGLLPDTGSVNVTVNTPNGTVTTTATVATQEPAFFMLDPEDSKYVAARLTDSVGTIIGHPGLYSAAPTATQPVPARNGVAQIYGTGWGVASPAAPDGTVFSGAFNLVTKPIIKIGGVICNVSFAGVVTPGLVQINVTMPDLPPGDYPIEGSINGVSAQTGAYITLGPAQ